MDCKLELVTDLPASSVFWAPVGAGEVRGVLAMAQPPWGTPTVFPCASLALDRALLQRFQP